MVTRISARRQAVEIVERFEYRAGRFVAAGDVVGLGGGPVFRGAVEALRGDVEIRRLWRRGQRTFADVWLLDRQRSRSGRSARGGLYTIQIGGKGSRSLEIPGLERRPYRLTRRRGR